MKTLNTKWYQTLELIAWFIILPLTYLFDLVSISKLLPLIALFLYCIILLIINKRIALIKWKLQANWNLIIVRFLLVCTVVVLFITFFTKNALLADLENNKKLFWMIPVYPFLSAFPQELIFREFFFSRYEHLFKNPTVLLIVNIILFSFAHIYFSNWIVIVSTLLVGTIFALTYLKTKSLLAVTLEHSLYGLMILSSGMWEYFYKAF